MFLQASTHFREDMRKEELHLLSHQLKSFYLVLCRRLGLHKTRRCICLGLILFLNRKHGICGFSFWVIMLRLRHKKIWTQNSMHIDHGPSHPRVDPYNHPLELWHDACGPVHLWLDARRQESNRPTVLISRDQPSKPQRPFLVMHLR